MGRIQIHFVCPYMRGVSWLVNMYWVDLPGRQCQHYKATQSLVILKKTSHKKRPKNPQDIIFRNLRNRVYCFMIISPYARYIYLVGLLTCNFPFKIDALIGNRTFSFIKVTERFIYYREYILQTMQPSLNSNNSIDLR